MAEMSAGRWRSSATPEQRYETDATFRALVDTLELQIREARFSGSELREAALLALIHYEATRLPEPFFLDDQNRPMDCPGCGAPAHRAHLPVCRYARNDTRRPPCAIAGHEYRAERGRPFTCRHCGGMIPDGSATTIGDAPA